MLKRGFTLVELLVVLAIISVIVSLLLPAVRIVREDERLSAVNTEILTISLAEDSYEEANGSYATVAQLVDEGLLTADFADGKKHGYEFIIDIDPPPLPEFRVHADPCVPPLSVGFFVDGSGIIRYEVDGSADASSAVFVDAASVPVSQAEIAQAAELEAEAIAFVRLLDALPGTGTAIQSTIDLLASEDLAPSVLAGLDENADGFVSLQDFSSADILALARAVKLELALPDDGTAVAGDGLLETMLSDYQAQFTAAVEPNEEYVAPAVPYAMGLSGDPSAFLIQALAQSMPGLAPWGVALLAALLFGATRWRRTWSGNSN